MSVLTVYLHNRLFVITHSLTMYIRHLIKADIMNSNTDMLIKQKGVTFWGRKNSVFKTTPPYTLKGFL